MAVSTAFLGLVADVHGADLDDVVLMVAHEPASVGLIAISWIPDVEDTIDNGPCTFQTGPNVLAIVASTSTG